MVLALRSLVIAHQFKFLTYEQFLDACQPVPCTSSSPALAEAVQQLEGREEEEDAPRSDLADGPTDRSDLILREGS